MAVTAIALCGLALFATGCGDSAADKEAACWTKYEALSAELAAVTAMTSQEVLNTYGISLRQSGTRWADEQGVVYARYDGSWPTSKDYPRVRDGVLAHIRSQFPDC